MKTFMKWFAFSALMLCTKTWAGVFTLPTLDTTQTDPIFRTLGSAMVFRSVEPASGYGRLWGIGIGVAVNGTSTSAVNSVFTGMTSSFLPSGEIQGGVTLPAGLTFEVGFLPSMPYQGTTFSKIGGAVKWTLNRTFLAKAPVDVAIRGSYSNGALTYVQAATGGDVTVNSSTNVFSGALVISKNFIVLEPFAGIGMVSQTTTLTATGVGSLFGPSFPPATTSFTGNSSSLWWHVGIVLNLQVLRLSGSYESAFGLTSWTGKVGFSI